MSSNLVTVEFGDEYGTYWVTFPDGHDEPFEPGDVADVPESALQMDGVSRVESATTDSDADTEPSAEESGAPSSPTDEDEENEEGEEEPAGGSGDPLSVACSFCGADPDEPCETDSGKVRSEAHADRVEEAAA